MEAPNPCTQILNHHEQPFTKKVGGQVVVKIFSFLGFKEACVLSTTSPEFAVYLHQRIQKEMEVSELVVKSFFHLSLSIKHRLSIKSSYWIYQEVFLSEDRKWRELFQKFNISYPESCIRTTEHFKEKRHIVYSHTRDYIDNFIEYCNGRETKNLTIDEEILYNGYLNRGIIPIIDFSDQTGVKIVSRFGTIGFAFHCQFYNIKSKHDLHSGMLVFCLSNTRSRSQCEVYIIENYKNTILFRENSVIFYLLILSKAEQNFTKLGCEQAKSGFGSFYVKLGTAPPLSKR